MTVYLDAVRQLPGRPWGRLNWCHMTADTEWELHLMADAIGLKREWYQRAHYDVSSKAKVSKALMLGAKVVPRRELAARRRQLLGDLQAKEAEHGAER